MNKFFKFLFAFLGLAMMNVTDGLGDNQWTTTKDGKQSFNPLSAEVVEKLEDADYNAYRDAEKADLEARLTAIKEGAVSKEDLAKMQDEITAIYKKQASDSDARLKTITGAMTEKIAELEARGIDRNTSKFEAELKAAFDEKVESFKGLKGGGAGSSASIIKATQTYGDITEGQDFAQMRTNITDQPVRRVIFRSLFSTTPLSTEFYKYPYQSSVVRDAQNVAVCSPVTSTTKEEITVGEIGYKKIKDRIDFCIDFVADYPFMRSRIDKLINESLALKIDQQILLGTGAGLETNSIDSYSSEFSAANVACVLTDKVDDANMVDLILGMQTQIEELGLQGSYMADTVIVNRCDWFTEVESRKNADGNYIDEKVTVVGGVPFIGGMRVVTSPLVAQNTLYVFDSTKGEILDRQDVNIDLAFENGTNWENDIVSMKGSAKLNFFVDPNYINAFMKCSDVAVAIAAIDKP